jgi:predicted RNA binding protein YcfA (HicA-like mRNA interferase family)
MERFPVDARRERVVRALERLGFRVIRQREHISMERENPDGGRTPLTMPAHRRIKGSTLRRICTQAGISREDFLKSYEQG